MLAVSTRDGGTRTNRCHDADRDEAGQVAAAVHSSADACSSAWNVGRLRAVLLQFAT